MEFKIRVNLASGIFAVLFGIAFWLLIPYQIISKQRLVTNAVGSDFVPKRVAIIIIILGLSLIIQSLLLKKDKSVNVVLRDEGRVFVVVAIIFANILLMPKIGFLVTSIASTAIILLFLKCKKWHYYAVTAALAAVIYFSFKYGLYIRLP